VLNKISIVYKCKIKTRKNKKDEQTLTVIIIIIMSVTSVDPFYRRESGDRDRDSWTDRLAGRQTDGKDGRTESYRQLKKQTGRQTDRQRNSQTNERTDRDRQDSWTASQRDG